ncbi:MAG: carbon-nitrogen hydrolase family protein [Desulfatitalea sp.]|nr:carbon-nitrogen hydrolase family protein [Desulfatitalea sp.]
MNDKVQVSAAQFSSVFLDRKATVQKAIHIVAEAARSGSRLVVFPEAFIPGYPCWVWQISAGEDRRLQELYVEYLENVVSVPGPDVDELCRAARQNKINVVMGISERNDEASRTSMFNSALFIDEKGVILGRRRKLVPTGGERLIWAMGDGSTLQTVDLPFGRVCALICWENYMPLTRYAMFVQGPQIYCALTWDRGEPWLSSMRHIAREGGLFLISAGMAMHLQHLPERFGLKQLFDAQQDDGWINGGDSVIVDTSGNMMAGPLHRQEGLLTAELDLRAGPGPKWELDVAGHYARPDVFQLAVNRDQKPLVIYPLTRP